LQLDYEVIKFVHNKKYEQSLFWPGLHNRMHIVSGTQEDTKRAQGAGPPKWQDVPKGQTPITKGATVAAGGAPLRATPSDGASWLLTAVFIGSGVAALAASLVLFLRRRN
jgi:hypothetical protein